MHIPVLWHLNLLPLHAALTNEHSALNVVMSHHIYKYKQVRQQDAMLAIRWWANFGFGDYLGATSS